MIPRSWLWGWALAATFLAAAGIYEAVTCRRSAAPLVVEIPKIEVREVVKEKKIPVPGPVRERDVLVGGSCKDWTDNDDRFTFHQEARTLETHQEFTGTVDPKKQQAQVQEISPKTGAVLRTIDVPLPGLKLYRPLARFRFEAGAYLREDGEWGPLYRGTFRPNRWTFVAAEKAEDWRIQGGVLLEF